jgi:membrane protein DedA with SNARE-associated domain
MINIDNIIPFDILDDGQFVYLGLFVISFILSIFIFVPVPNSPIVIAAALDKRLDPNLISIYSALGIITAKAIIFYLAYYGRSILSRTSRKNSRMLILQKLARKYGWKAAIIAAMTPIPDDIVYISLAIGKYSPWKFIASAFAGKLIINEIMAWGAVYLGKPFVDLFISGSMVDPIYIIIVVTASISVLIITIYIFLKVDLDKIIQKRFPKAFDDDDDE